VAESKEQKIVVLTSLTPSDNSLLLHGAQIAAVFKKELCLVHNLPKRKRNRGSSEKLKLTALAETLKNEIPGMQISSLLVYANNTVLPDILADKHEAIFLIASSMQFKKYRKIVSETPVPFLFVRPGSEINGYNKLVQPIDFRKENSDASLWCSYFGRFNKAEVVLIAANDRHKTEKRKVARNVEISRRLYKKFNIVHQVYKSTKNSFRTSFEALELALASDSNLLVILGSSTITPLDALLGLPERKIVERAGNLPVLIVNPRKDNYVLCD
jgi:hypothetical protein